MNKPTSKRKRPKQISRAELAAYIEDRKNVFGDPDRFGLAVLIAFLGPEQKKKKRRLKAVE
jgi:hypothetical protein